MNRNVAQKVKVILLVFALILVLSMSDSGRLSDGYMVRAVLLQQEGNVYQVGVLYQDPEAAANSADVQASIKLARAEGDSLLAAFQALEQDFAAELSYQLSDYLLLCGACSKQTLAEYALQVQTTQCGRYAAQVSYLSQDLATLAVQIEQDAQLAQLLLETLQAAQAPYLYQVSEETLVMPRYDLQEDGALLPAQTMYLLQESGAGTYDAVQTQLYRLLSDTDTPCYFANDTVAFCIKHRVLSYTGTLAGVSSEWSWGGNGSEESEESRAFSVSEQVAQTTLQDAEIPDENAQSSLQDAEMADENAQTTLQDAEIPDENGKTLLLYAILADTQDTAALSLVQIELYLSYLVNRETALLAQLGVARVEVHLARLAQWV